MAIEDEFAQAQTDVRSASSVGTGELLKLYGLFKQSTAGDVSGKRPGMLDVKGRAKFDAWTELKGSSREDAMAAYVAFVAKLLA
jgi:diazepam-binding inhibitor (GABA receptor modulator, acyl-CoA-binding protein)